MPYIKEERKLELAGLTRAYADPDVRVAGELNYKITLLLIEYMKLKGLSYQTINDIMGALEGSKAEFYRRIAAPYEDSKIKQNGDVY